MKTLSSFLFVDLVKSCNLVFCFLPSMWFVYVLSLAFLLFCSRLLFFLFLSITEYSILPSKITNKLWQKMYPTFKEMLNVQFTTVLYLEPLTTMNLILFFYLKIYLFQLWFLIMHNRQRTKFTFLQEKTLISFSLLLRFSFTGGTIVKFNWEEEEFI